MPTATATLANTLAVPNMALERTLSGGDALSADDANTRQKASLSFDPLGTYTSAMPHWFTLLLLLVATNAFSAPEQVVDYEGCELRGHLRDAARTGFVLRLRDAPYSAAAQAARGPTHWWGTDSGRPRRVTAELSLVLGGRPVVVAHRAYADLGDPIIPGGVSLSQSGRDLLLHLDGGDAAGSFRAKFVFRGGRLLRREVVRGESSDDKPQVLRFGP